MATTDSDGNVFYDDGDLNIVGPFGDTLFTNDPGGDINGAFGGAIADFILYGVVNGAFSQGPGQGVNTAIGSNNQLPYWTGPWVVSGNSIQATWVADASSPSGYNLRFSIAAGAAGDEAYFEQIVPIGGERGGRNYHQLMATAYRVVASGGSPLGTLAIQFLKADGTTTGAATTGTLALAADATLYKQSLARLAAPGDASAARLRVGVRRNTMAATDTATIDIPGVRVLRSGGLVVLPDTTDPQTYGPGGLYQDGGVVWLQPQRTDFSASASGLLIDDTTPQFELFATAGLGAGVANLHGDASGVYVSQAPLQIQEQASPGTPASGRYSIYPKTDHALYGMGSDGVETRYGGAGGKTVLRPTISGTVNDWNPTGLAHDVIFSPSLGGVNRTITGITALADGAVIYMTTSVTQTITLSHLSASSAAANQIKCPGGVDYVVTNKAGVALWYDLATTNWQFLDK